MRRIICLTLAVLAALSPGCTLTPGQASDSSFSFEEGFEGWTANATDVGDPGGALAEWSITRSQDRAADGTTSVKLYLANFTDAGKIWIERPFTVQPNSRYRVQVRYAFASEDYGDMNLWTIIAGVLPKHPLSIDDLQPAFQGDTGNGRSTATDFVWLDKAYTFTVQSDSTATLHVVIGVWGTYEVARTYYLDSVRVTIEET